MWYLINATEITWFIIGFLIAAGINSLSHGNWTDAAFSFVLAGANYYLNKK
jgi:hypothetical protein